VGQGAPTRGDAAWHKRKLTFPHPESSLLSRLDSAYVGERSRPPSGAHGVHSRRALVEGPRGHSRPGPGTGVSHVARWHRRGWGHRLRDSGRSAEPIPRRVDRRPLWTAFDRRDPPDPGSPPDLDLPLRRPGVGPVDPQRRGHATSNRIRSGRTRGRLGRTSPVTQSALRLRAIRRGEQQPARFGSMPCRRRPARPHVQPAVLLWWRGSGDS
jgi:hypothetical protein